MYDVGCYRVVFCFEVFESNFVKFYLGNIVGSCLFCIFDILMNVGKVVEIIGLGGVV